MFLLNFFNYIIDNPLVKQIFLHKLFSWYAINKRELPFRNTVNPYYIWLSEIILQQTRVAQGLPYYEKFISIFPSVDDLARAEENEVLNAWQGLGYYSRARNLHFTAKFVVDNLNSVFPTSYIELIKLKGIGDYTASAISSFSAKEIAPVLDGNVYRFISRLYGIETPINTPKSIKEFKQVLNELIDHENPDVFNQAIIEYGALYCTPKSPECESCIFSESCFAFSNNKISDFPVKLKKKKSIDRFLNFYLLIEKNSFYILKREENAIWKNLYEYPNLESKELFESEMLNEELSFSFSLKKVVGPFKHVLSHQNIYAKLFVCELINNENIEENWIKVNSKTLNNYPIHRLMEKMIEKQ
ncbi:A/G-specific adenine glycosylase [bacterium]|nr:A/G-specific adenine glycosylase [bacterium]MDB4089099.1 A/G-specific adenine glycosylase [Flavobacteriales bacterium]